MDPVSPVVQLAVAGISSVAFLVFILLVPFPEPKSDPSGGVMLPSLAGTTIAHPAVGRFAAGLK
jgi:hypothetical protein